MCSRASGLFCACLLVSCVVHCGHCSGHQDSHSHSHSDHRHHDTDDGNSSEEKTNSRFFVRELFNKYGHNGVLTFVQFEKMLQSVGLKSVVGKMQEQFHHHHHHTSSGLPHKEIQKVSPDLDHGSVNVSKKEDRNSSATQVAKTEHTPSFNSISLDSLEDFYSPEPEASLQLNDLNSSATTIRSISDSYTGDLSHISFSDKCLTAAEILRSHGIDANEEFITQRDFFHVCPAIVYQMVQSKCVEHSDHFNVHSEFRSPSYQVWLYASLSVLVISLCGLLSVAVIPIIIQRMCYHTLLQFLIALAVGSLSGDALLHLFPHSVSEHHNHDADGDHSSTVWRGLTALTGIYTFFLFENLLNALSNYRRMKQSAKVLQVPKFSRALTRVDGEQSRVVGEKLSHHKHGLSETVLEEKEPVTVSEKIPVPSSDSQKDTLHISSEVSTIAVEDLEQGQLSDWEKSSSKCIEQNGDPSSPMKPLHVDVTYLPSDRHPAPESPTEECHRETVVYRHAHDQGYIVTVTDHHHHGHSHSEIPPSGSTVAWMVVMGDGLHNFCDGLAIGSAFAVGIPKGISTAIAVLCHELPHELGDFAMLLKAGMNAKKALLYNGISSGLCFLGMLFGVAFGNIASASSWIFSGVTGIFLFVALSVMLPELSVSRVVNARSFQQLFIQMGGIALGISIMLLIAIYESDLQMIIS